MVPITVPASFMADWDLFCTRAGLNRREQTELREQVRRDFAGLGRHISETAAVYRFCDTTWGYVPGPDLARGYLASRGWYPEDETIFMRFGPLLLAKICAEVAGALPK